MRVETIGRATLYCGDTLACMAAVEGVDALITDPPYCSGSVSEASRSAAKGQGLRSETITRLGWFTGDNMGTAGLVFLLRSVAFEACRVLPPTGSMLTFCDWRMVPNLAPAIESAGLRYQNMVVWDKGAMGLGAGFRSQHETILHHTNGSPAYHNLGTGNVIRAGRVTADEREHQTQKPLDLMAKLIRVVCPAGGVVLDPFMGSGSTGVAAIQAGYGFVGIERSPDHFETACRRIREASGDDSGPLFAQVAAA
jgi:DNA modification methylase